MSKTFTERCKMFEQCLPDASYRALLAELHAEMLAELAEQPAREWVGLTYEEVNSWELPDTPTVYEFAKFIEAKLKEKNT